MRHFTKFFLALSLLTLCATAHAQVSPVPPGIHVSPAVWAECERGIDISRCASTIKPQPCPAGEHWSLKGTGKAHCVLTTTPCPAGGYQTEDFFGNLSCRPAGSLSTASATPLPRIPPPPPPPPTTPPTLYYNHTIQISGYCSQGGCTINFQRSVEAIVTAGGSQTAALNADLQAVMQAMTIACPRQGTRGGAAGWVYGPQDVTIGNVIAQCETDPEPGVVIPGQSGPYGHPGRSTMWIIDINGIPK